MPPPFWRSSGAIFHVQESLEALQGLLERLVQVHSVTESRLAEYFRKHPHDTSEDNSDFCDICDELWEVEHRIKLKSEVAVLMSAIAAEDKINMFCVYNLPRDVSEQIEKLSATEKLLVASALSAEQSVKGLDVFEAIKKLSAWRNAFAHGHCVDRPTKSLRHNHLISPTEYPGVPSALSEVKELVGGFVKVSDYLGKISKNAYLRGPSSEVEDVRSRLLGLRRFQFSGNNRVYSIVVRPA